jgi:hypothetical protein
VRYGDIGDVITLKENYNHFFGSMVSNPFEGADQNVPINIEQGIFVPNDPPGVYVVNNMAHYNGALLSVHFLTDEWSTVEGTAVMVAPGIAFSAAHVIEPLMPHIMAKQLRVVCVGYTSTGPRYWRVGYVTKINNSEIVILALKYATALPADGRFVQTMITTRLPGIGEQVMIAGIRASREHVEADADFAFPILAGNIKYGADVWIAVGEVTQHHLSGRGAMAPSPAIEVACSTPGGLSGGPAFDKHGKIFGILSASMSIADPDDGRGPSQISMIWPGLAMTVSPAFLERFMPASFRLLDLDDRLCGIDRRDVIRTSVDAATGLIRMEWDNYT